MRAGWLDPIEVFYLIIMTLKEMFPELSPKKRSKLGDYIKDHIKPIGKIKETHTFLVNDYSEDQIYQISLLAVKFARKEDKNG